MGNILQKLKALKEKCEGETVFVDCQQCLKPIPLAMKFTNKDHCSHVFCKGCMAKYVGSKLEINAIEITCPGADCKTVLDPISCRALTKDRLFKSWLDRLCYSAIAGLEKCYYPYENCRALIVNECGGEAMGSKCPECKRWYCFRCRTPWHNGRRCSVDRPEKISLNDMLFTELTLGKKKVSSCPKCHMYIELVPKLGYCIVKCRCGTVFCFHCRRECNRLSCYCKEFKNEIEDYTGCLMSKYMLCVFLMLIAMYIWSVNIEKDNDDYF